MATNAWKLLILSFLIKSFAKCDDNFMKSSLVFVIDDTGSMANVINTVKQYANRIFDAVLNNEDSQIDNFVLVTFKDPYVRQRVVTRDRNAFKQALDSIIVGGGGDCPEFSLSGIELGLELSLPRSQVYVFTDASAKDYSIYEQVKNRAQEKSSQIIFALTAGCANEIILERSLVYDRLASATSGRVFHLWTQNIDELLNWLVENVKGRMAVVAKKEFPPGYHNLTYTKDHHTSQVFISVTGTKPQIHVVDPKGSVAPTRKVIDRSESAVVKVESQETGTYTASISSPSKTSVIVTGKTTIDFVHGFSTSIPTSIKGTSTKPLPDVKSYLLIDLDILKGGEVKLTSIRILDLEDNVLLEQQLKIVDEETRLYATVDPFEPPKQMFNILVTGYVVDNNEVVKRMVPTPLEPESVAPRIQDNGKTTYTALKEYDTVLKIPCHATGYPKPTMTWKVDGKPIPEGSKYSVKEGALIVRSPLVSDSGEYTCTATNKLGTDSKVFKGIVEDGINRYDKVHNVHVLAGKQFELKCQLPYSESDVITWFYNDQLINTKPHTKTLHLEGDISKDGNYSCRVSNENGYVMDTYEVDFGFAPTFKAYQDEVFDWRGKGDMDCAVTAKPSATVQWIYNGKRIGVDDDQLILPISGLGQYMCIATNAHGSVKRNFNITTSACLINNKEDLDWRSPIFVAEDGKWLHGKTENDFYVISNEEKLTLSCRSQDSVPNSFRTLPGTDEVKATCVGENKFLVDGKSYKYSDLKCDRDIKPQVKRTGEQCFNKDTEMIQIGYQLKEFVEVYRVCFDVVNNVPLYSQVKNLNDNKFTGSVPHWHVAPGLESKKKNSYTYNKSSQNCGVVKKQLLNGNYVPFGAAQRSTFIENLNTVPVWQNCDNSRADWSDIESALELYIDEIESMWSGASHYVDAGAE
ncbi:hemicentin-1 [Manduca sexta]|uniref:hemicentin-1 n=1 Tax=Manduca sexta TaxID=7130 RepID=UPI00188DE525|nr:hemicentin-1 [Manduca sexta]